MMYIYEVAIMEEKYLKMKEIDDMDEWVIKIYTPENAKKNIIEKINNTAVDLHMESKCENKL
jgi:hypothetical protein